MLTLTKLERDILNHRLEVPDAICEALNADTTEDLERWHPDDVDDVCECFLNGEFQKGFDVSEMLAKEVLVDAVEGSTYFGAAIADQSDQKKAAIAKAGKSLADKVDFIVERDEPIEFPLY